MRLYHHTSHKFVPGILAKGLVPKDWGDNEDRSWVQKPCVWLTTMDDLTIRPEDATTYAKYTTPGDGPDKKSTPGGPG